MRRVISKTDAMDNLLSAEVEVVPAYQDCDPAGVVWHGNYFHFFDRARVALLEKLDYGYRQMEDSGYVYPIIDTRVRYLSSATYDQPLVIRAVLREWEYRLKITYEVLDAERKCVTEAYTVQVAVDIADNELCIGCPEPLLERLARAGLTVE